MSQSEPRDEAAEEQAIEELAIEELAPNQEQVDRFLAADRRTRVALLREFKSQLTAIDVALLIPTLRDATPKLAARLVALIARHQLRAPFESELARMRPGKRALLRAQFERMTPAPR